MFRLTLLNGGEIAVWPKKYKKVFEKKNRPLKNQRTTIYIKGVRVSLFVSGCRNHCKNCFQPETWNFDYGTPYTEETEEHIIQLLSKPYIQGLTILGGEPFEPENQRGLIRLLQRVKADCPEKDIWCYTGYTLEQALTDGSSCRCEVTDAFLSMIDTLVDGRFVEELKDITLKFRGSSNQRIISMKEWRKQNEQKE